MFWSQSKEKPWIMGHRGIRALYPENTLISFQAAIDYGLDGIETDVHMTADGQLVLHHDKTLERTTTGEGEIENFTYGDLRKLDAGVKFSPEFAGQYIPRLEELLERIDNPAFALNVEMKDYRIEALDKTVELLEKSGFSGRYVITCFDAGVTTLAHEQYGLKVQGFPLHYIKNLREDTESHYYSVGIPMKELTAEVVDSYTARGIDPWCWCPDTEEEVMAALAAGSTLMTVNDPRAAFRVLGRG